jgi:hypothetical protein
MQIYENRHLHSILWIIFYLVLIDIAVNIVFKFPKDPQKTAPSSLQGYFEYGRSIEGKFDKMAFAAQLQVDPTVGYGWLEGQVNDKMVSEPGKNNMLVAVYGMSHTKQLGDAMARIISKYKVRSICAPGAPVGWGYAAYNLDKDKHSAKVVVWGIMTDNVPFTGATLGATIYFDLGHPYTFPRYYVENGALKTIFPPFLSLRGFREYRSDPVKWREYREWLSRYDEFYDPFLFKKGLSDYSAILRILRRAYAQYTHERAFNRVYTKEGFKTDSEEITTLRMMVEEFAESARRQNRIPIIYIVNNRDRGDYLYRALKPTLDAKNIPFLSSHTICPPDDPKVYTGDGHFTPEKNVELAKEMIGVIERELAKEAHPLSSMDLSSRTVK